MYHTNISQRKAGVAILVSDKENSEQRKSPETERDII